MGCWLLVAVVVVVVVVAVNLHVGVVFWVVVESIPLGPNRAYVGPPLPAQIATKNKLRLSIL